jgi:pyroglutamyl-peptidase
MRVVLTGFVPFPGVEINPAQLVVERVSAKVKDGSFQMRSAFELTAEVLPTAFQSAGVRIRELIRDIDPDIVISLGVAARRDAICLERFALNVNDAPKPDNDGVLANGEPIVVNGPDAYRSTLPIESLHKAIQECNIPVKFSNHAGAYVCNHVFYSARDEIEQSGSNAKCGFIHIPMHREAEGHPFAGNGLPIDTLVEAVLCCLEVLTT